MQGREVAVLVDETRAAGRHVVSWEGRDRKGQRLAAGTHFLRLELDGRSEARKVTLTR